MAEEYTECLLENKFHEDCPGCKVDQMKRLRRGFPLWELFTVWIIVLCTGKFNYLLVNFMEKKKCFGVDKRKKKKMFSYLT